MSRHRFPLRVSSCDLCHFPRLFRPRLHALELGPRAWDHERACVLAAGKHHTQVLLGGRKSDRRISRCSTSLNALRHTRSDDVSRAEAQMHLHVASVKVSHVLLLDKADKDGRDGLLPDGDNVDLCESVLYLHDFGVDLVTSAWLKRPSTLITRLSCPLRIVCTLCPMEGCDTDLIRCQLVPVVCLYDLNKASNLRIDLA
mmetsp:Transcript_12772/g.17196  ORF Transcript_12772/g.17196 Transcript_12772/m.17196 type:complete len:200 (-) Transcript_12772:104-703(-)